MIAACPKCSARYRIDAARLGPEGAKLRCTKCSALFLVRVPPPPPLAAQSAAMAPASPVAPAPSSFPAAPSPGDPNAAFHGELPVLVADSDAARAKASAEAIRTLGLASHVVHDGVEAMLAIQRLLPRVVVLDAALPRMYGFQVCEIVKRNPSLRHIHVVLIGAVHDAGRYRRDPTDLYGADAYLEQPDLPDGLLPLLRQAGLFEDRGPSGPCAGGPAAPSPAFVPKPAATPAPAPAPMRNTPPAPVAIAPVAPPAPVAAANPEREEARERARRLARIAVSEMVLYQPERFATAARDGTLERALELEIQEARALLRQRIGADVLAEGDFVLEELHRVARERIARG